MSVSDDEIAAIEQRAQASFKAPWRYDSFEIDCGYDDCTIDACRNDPEKHSGYEHEIVEVTSPEEYPDGQVVAQIQVPGLEQFAKANGEFISAARTDVPRLCAELREARKEMARTRIEDRRTIDAALCERDEARAGVARLREALEEIIREGGAGYNHAVLLSDIARAALKVKP